MSVYLPDNRITAPELFYPGRKPTVPVKIKANHPISKGVLFCSIFNRYSGRPFNLVTNNQFDPIVQKTIWTIGRGADTTTSGGYNCNVDQPALSATDNYFWHIRFDLKSTSKDTAVIFGNRFDGVPSPLQFFKITPSGVEYYNGQVYAGLYGQVITSGLHSVSAIKRGSTLIVILDGERVAIETGLPAISSNPVYIGNGRAVTPTETTELTAIMAIHGRITISESAAASLHLNPYQFLEAA